MIHNYELWSNSWIYWIPLVPYPLLANISNRYSSEFCHLHFQNSLSLLVPWIVYNGAYIISLLITTLSKMNLFLIKEDWLISINISMHFSYSLVNILEIILKVQFSKLISLFRMWEAYFSFEIRHITDLLILSRSNLCS